MIYYIGNNCLPYEEFTCATPDTLLDWVKDKSIIAVDTETTRKYKKGLYDESVYIPGLDPKFTKICMLQIGDQNDQFIIDARSIDIRLFKEILESKKILKVLHNAKFDAKQLLEYDICLQNVWDTMICERILFNGLPYSYSLEKVSIRRGLIQQHKDTDLFDYTEELEFEEEQDILSLMDNPQPMYIDKSVRTQFVNWGDKPFTVSQIEYGAKDLILPLQLYELQKEGRIVNGELYKPTKAFEIENKFCIALAHMEKVGLRIDTLGWQDLYKKNLTVYNILKDKLNNWIETYYPEFSSKLDLFTERPTCTIDWQSSDQVKVFFKKQGICPKERSKQTKKQEFTVGAKALFKTLTNKDKDSFYKNDYRDFEGKEDFDTLKVNYLIFKKHQMLTTTFGVDFLRWIHPITKRIHCNFQQFMNTSRMSAQRPNLQNIPNGKEWRKLFISDPNEDLIAVDFSAMEIRYLSVLADIDNLKDFFIKEHPIFKDDIHSFSATNMFRIVRNDPNLIVTKETHKAERNISKTLTFGINYGKGAFSVAQELGITEEEAQKFIDAFLDGFPGLRENFETRKKQALKTGWIELDFYTGKRYFYPHFEKMQSLLEKAKGFYPPEWKQMSKEQKEDWKAEFKAKNPEYTQTWTEYMVMKGELERKALNYPIQGGSATITKLAILFVLGAGFNLASAVHDELLVFAPESKSQIVCKEVMNLMEKAGSLFSDDVKFTTEGAVGKYWIH